MGQGTLSEQTLELGRLQKGRGRAVLATRILLGALVAGLVIAFAIALPYFAKAWRGDYGDIRESRRTPTARPATSSASPIEREKLTVPQPASAEEQATTLWTELEKSVWGASLEDWSSAHTDVPCDGFHGNMYGGGADRQWSHRCAVSAKREFPRWYFYVFSLQEPLTQRLEQFEMTTTTLPDGTLEAVASSLQARLSSRYGPAEDRTPKFERIRLVTWPRDLHWKTADLEIQLNLSEFDPQKREGRLQLQARHSALLEALKDDERLKVVGASDFLYQTNSWIDKQLADALRSDFPDVAEMLMKDSPDPDPQKMHEAVQQAIQQRQNQLKSSQSPGQTGGRAVAAFAIAVPQNKWKGEQFYNAVVRLLTNAKTSGADRQPILLLAADRLAARLPNVIYSDKSQNQDWNDWEKHLATFGVSYALGTQAPWDYRGELLKRVAADYEESVWGERAFVLLLTHGWDTSYECAAGSDQFREVIRQGLAFLEKHPKSPYQLEVQLDVAQAYETWWSLSQSRQPGADREIGAEDAEADANPQEYQEGAEAARRQAIARFDRLLQTAPNSDEAAYARRVLPRLKLGIDTGQRRFYCTIGD